MDITHDIAFKELQAHDPDIIGHLWSCEGHEGCDTAHMLIAVSGNDIELHENIYCIMKGHAPAYSTPYPECATELLKRRTAQQ